MLRRPEIGIGTRAFAIAFTFPLYAGAAHAIRTYTYLHACNNAHAFEASFVLLDEPYAFSQLLTKVHIHTHSLTTAEECFRYNECSFYPVGNTGKVPPSPRHRLYSAR